MPETRMPRSLNTWEAMTTQRAVRRFADRPIGQTEIDLILEAGRRAPSSKNEQRWRFIVCRDRSHLRELSRLGPYADHVAGAAMAIAFVTPEVPDVRTYGSIMYDLGQATQNMMLAAVSAGIGSVHAAVYEHDLARRLLGYPEGYRCDYLVSFGYPAKAGLLDAPRRRVPRVPLAELVHDEPW